VAWHVKPLGHPLFMLQSWLSAAPPVHAAWQVELTPGTTIMPPPRPASGTQHCVPAGQLAAPPQVSAMPLHAWPNGVHARVVPPPPAARMQH
jgi:hypothetical protein